MQTPPDVFFHLSATGWTAIGSIVGAASIIALSVFNVLTLRAAFRATRAAESQSTTAQTSLELLRDQLALTERPFIAIHSEYCKDINAYLVYAHNQGNGPALDVEASPTYDELTIRKDEYSIGCMALDGRFQFKIGDRSNKLSAAAIWYKSIANEKWTTKITILAGHPAITTVTKGHPDDDARLRRIQNFLARATQTEE
jgi:3',5'-cyclic AMP phosphodiesterase CpdA